MGPSEKTSQYNKYFRDVTDLYSGIERLNI